jgi:hypothetical protein
MKRRANQGMAIVSALGFLVITVIFVGAAMMMGVSNRRLSADSYQATRAQYAAEAALDRAVYEAYTNVLNPGYAADTAWQPSVTTYQEKLNSVMVNNASKEFNSQTLSDSSSYDLKIDRQDFTSPKRTELTITATGKYGNAKRRITQKFSVEGGRFPGDAYAVLTNNANCIFCHTTVTSIEAAYNSSNTTNPIKALSTSGLTEMKGTNRVRVAALQSLIVDRAVDSLVTGSIYTRGATNLLTQGGAKSIKFQNNGKSESLDNAANNLSETNCANAATNPASCPAFGNFYTKYPDKNPPDGVVPDAFPQPIPDKDNDKVIDDDEWSDAIGDDPDVGSIKGGTKKLLSTPTYGTLSASLSLTTTADQLTITKLTINRGIAGNLILSGDMEIKNNVYVDGDVVISGTIRGSGKIIARGNVYVVGDIKYNCASSTATYTACDYSDPSKLPEFGLIAGGNMLIGPYMVTGASNMSWNTTYEGTSYTDGNSTYKADFFNQVMKDSTSKSPEFIDPGKYLPFYDPRVPREAMPFYDSAKAITHANNTGALAAMRSLYGLAANATPTTAQSNSYSITYNTTALTNLNTYCNCTSPTDAQKSDYGNKSWSNQVAKPQMLTHFGVSSLTSLTDKQLQSYARATYVKGDEKTNGTKLTNRTRGSFTADEMSAFNQREYCKAVQSGTGCAEQGLADTYTDGYIPRFYRFRPGATLSRCAQRSGTVDPSNCRSYGNPNGEMNEGANYTEITESERTNLRAVVMDLTPDDNWLAKATNSLSTDYRDSELAIKDYWVKNVENNSRGNGIDAALKLDGIMYSSNAIFAMAQTRSSSKGSMVVNGSIVGADLGILTGGNGSTSGTYNNDGTSTEQRGLHIHYDQRLSGLLGVKNKGGLVLTRTTYKQIGNF